MTQSLRPILRLKLDAECDVVSPGGKSKNPSRICLSRSRYAFRSFIVVDYDCDISSMSLLETSLMTSTDELRFEERNIETI